MNMQARKEEKSTTAEEDPDNVTTSAECMLDHIARTKGTAFPHIMLFNSIHTTGSSVDGIEDLIFVHTNLMALHGFMAGFQYVVLTSDNSSSGSAIDAAASSRTQAIVFFASLWILTQFARNRHEFDCHGVPQECVQKEPMDLQVHGILIYGPYFRLSDVAATIAATLLLVSTILVLYDSALPTTACIVINVVSGVGCFSFLLLFKTCIMDRQNYTGGRHLYQRHRQHLQNQQRKQQTRTTATGKRQTQQKSKSHGNEAREPLQEI